MSLSPDHNVFNTPSLNHSQMIQFGVCQLFPDCSNTLNVFEKFYIKRVKCFDKTHHKKLKIHTP